MARQYKRNYELLIDKDGVRRQITDLRIQFEVTKSLRSYPNIAKIVIFNASDDTNSFLDSELTKVTLNAGYENNLNLVFIGKIRNSIQSRQGVDSITTVYSADGQKDWEQAIFNKTFSENISIETIVKELAETLTETGLGELSGLDMPADKLRGQTLSGSTKDILDTLGQDYGFEWSIQDNVLVTVPIEDVVYPESVILINNSTGMIGTPSVTEIGADAKVLLNTNLAPNRAFRIESISQNVQLGNLNFRNIKKTKAEGTYKVFEVIHKGDTHDNEWSSSVKGASLVRLS